MRKGCKGKLINEFGTFTSGDITFLHAINPKGRNEPHCDVARFHRFTVLEMLDDYAERMGLTRQPPFNNETPPWSPNQHKHFNANR